MVNFAIYAEINESLTRVNLENEKAFKVKCYVYLFLGVIFSLYAITIIRFFILEIKIINYSKKVISEIFKKFPV